MIRWDGRLTSCATAHALTLRLDAHHPWDADQPSMQLLRARHACGTQRWCPADACSLFAASPWCRCTSLSTTAASTTLSSSTW
eukprot:358364-Chlamydomonas_euryale.AAC.8